MFNEIPLQDIEATYKAIDQAVTMTNTNALGLIGIIGSVSDLMQGKTTQPNDVDLLCMGGQKTQQEELQQLYRLQQNTLDLMKSYGLTPSLVTDSALGPEIVYTVQNHTGEKPVTVHSVYVGTQSDAAKFLPTGKNGIMHKDGTFQTHFNLITLYGNLENVPKTRNVNPRKELAYIELQKIPFPLYQGEYPQKLIRMKQNYLRKWLQKQYGIQTPNPQATTPNQQEENYLHMIQSLQ